MAGYYPSCENVVVAHNCDPCTEPEFGRLRSAAFVREDYLDTLLADIDNPAVWAAGQNDDLKVIVIPKTHGEVPAATEIVLPGYGDVLEEVISFDRTATFFDPNYVDNCDFYNAMQRARNYHFVYRTSTKLHVTQIPATIIPKAPVADDIGTRVEWNVLVKWRNLDAPCPYPVPEGIFDACYIPE